jgi:hypothetical protein
VLEANRVIRGYSVELVSFAVIEPPNIYTVLIPSAFIELAILIYIPSGPALSIATPRVGAAAVI